MTTQPETAVGEPTNLVAVEPTLEDRFSAISEEEEEIPQEGDISNEADRADDIELTGEDVAEAEADLPPIVAPVSWTAEEKEEFNQLPRQLQETLTRRETEREKFVQSKSQEALRARQEVETQAFAEIQEIKRSQAEQLAEYANLLNVSPPDPSLIATDPHSYARQLQQYQYYTAQREQAQRQAGEAQAIADQAEKELQAREAHEFHTVLQEKFPEFLDPSNAKTRENLGSIARDLGYSADQLREADATDILAMKQASEWKAKADRYDTLLAKQMEKVRAAKGLPKITRPGTAQGKGVAEGQRYESDRQAMRNGDQSAGARVFGRFL